MKTKFALVLLLVGSSAFASKKALVYNGPGACADGCYQSAFQVALQAGLDPVYVAADALTASSTEADRAKLFKDAVVWIQPGGKSSIAMKSITPQLKTAIQNFVKTGGGYVGFCAGAFASTSIVGTTNVKGFGFMPGRTVLFSDPNTRNADIIPIEWQGKTRNIYWEGGPFLTSIPQGGAEVVAHYPNGMVAAARASYGIGKVFVTGLHPEAPEEWRKFYGLHDSDGLDQELAVEMLHWVSAP